MDRAAGEGGWRGGLHPQSGQSGNHSHQKRSPGEESRQGLSQVCATGFHQLQYTGVTNERTSPRCRVLNYLVILIIIFIGPAQTKHHYKVKHGGLYDILGIQLTLFENIHRLAKVHFSPERGNTPGTFLWMKAKQVWADWTAASYFINLGLGWKITWKL